MVDLWSAFKQAVSPVTKAVETTFGIDIKDPFAPKQPTTPQMQTPSYPTPTTAIPKTPTTTITYAQPSGTTTTTITQPPKTTPAYIPTPTTVTYGGAIINPYTGQPIYQTPTGGATVEDVKRAVETAQKMATEAYATGRVPPTAYTPQELATRGIQPWEQVQYIPTGYETVRKEDREIGKVRTEVTTGLVTYDIVYSEISRKELEKRKKELGERGFEVSEFVDITGGIGIRGTMKPPEGQIWTEYGGKKITETMPFIEETPIMQTVEVKEPSDYIALVGEDIEFMKKVKERYETLQPIDRLALIGTTPIETRFETFLEGKPQTEAEKKVLARLERIREMPEEEKPEFAEMFWEFGLPAGATTVAGAIGSGALVTKIALTPSLTIGGRAIAGETLAKGIGLGLGVPFAISETAHIKELLEKGEITKVEAKILSDITHLGLATAGGLAYAKFFAPKPPKVEYIGTYREDVGIDVKETMDVLPRIVRTDTEKLIAETETKQLQDILGKAFTKGKTIEESKFYVVKRFEDQIYFFLKGKTIGGEPLGATVEQLAYRTPYRYEMPFERVSAIESYTMPVTTKKPPSALGTEIFKPSKITPDPLKDILFVEKPFTKETYAFRPKELLKGDFWTGLATKLGLKHAPVEVQLPTPKTTSLIAPFPITEGVIESKEFKIPESKIETKAVAEPKISTIISEPMAISEAPPISIPAPIQMPTEKEPIYPTSTTFIDPIILGKPSILIYPEQFIPKEEMEEEFIEATTLKGKIIEPKGLKEKIIERRKPEEFPILTPTTIEIQREKIPEEMGLLPIQATMERELLGFKERLKGELKEEELLRPIPIAIPTPSYKLMLGTMTTQQLKLLEEPKLEQLLEPTPIRPDIGLPVGFGFGLPEIDIPSGFDFKMPKLGEIGGRKTQYQPSLEAVVLGIKAPKGWKEPKLFTGMEVRPLKPRRKKK